MPTERVQKDQYPHGALPIGTRLGEFEVRRVLGVGGFGIVYLAFDHLLEREVAVKEYMPAALVGRDETMHVSLLTHSNSETFALGLRSFVNESRLLARFDHPSLVKVHRFWEANGTAYMAMSLYKGRTVRDVRQSLQTKPTEAWVRSVLEPLLGAIEKLHSEDVFHRDIAPDNILIEADGRPVLLDFGAARRVIADRSQALTAILKPSYAPIEQYAEVPGMKQGAWTDIYALGATVHFLLLGRPPPPAPGRTIQDEMKPLAQQKLEGCSQQFLELIDWMLSPRPTDRPQSVNEVREALAGRLTPPKPVAPEPVKTWDRTEPMPGPAGRPAGNGIDDATMIMPRPGSPNQPPHQPTMVMPRAGAGNAPNPTRAIPPTRSASVDEDATVVTPRGAAPVPDADATVVTPRPTAFVPPRTTAMPIPTATQRPATAPAPASTPTQRTTVRPPPVELDPAPRKAGAMASLLPVLAGALLVLGGGAAWIFWPSSKAPAPEPSAPVVQQTAPSPPAAVTPAPTTPAPAAVTVAPVATAETASAAAATREQNAVIEQLLPPAPAAAKPAPASPAPAAVTPAVAPKPAPAKPAQRVNEPPPASSYTRPPEPAPAPPRVQPAPEPVTPAPPPQQSGHTPPAATPPAPAEPASPLDRCRKELPLVRLVCMDIACGKAEFKSHPECVKLRADQERQRTQDTK